MFKKLMILLCVLLWPLNLYLANTPINFLRYVIPAILLGIAYFLYKKHPKYYLVPILAIGIFEIKLVLIPVLFCLFEIISKISKRGLIFLGISLAVFFLSFSGFKGQTIFNRDYESEQLIIRNIHLYPNVPMARLFQNKAKIYFNKAENNFFSLIDLNNYFFAGHPAPTILQTQELYKYFWPFIIFLLIGIYHVKSIDSSKFIFYALVSIFINLMILNNFDRQDFILWVPISLIIIHGVKKIF